MPASTSLRGPRPLSRGARRLLSSCRRSRPDDLNATKAVWQPAERRVTAFAQRRSSRPSRQRARCGRSASAPTEDWHTAACARRAEARASRGLQPGPRPPRESRWLRGAAPPFRAMQVVDLSRARFAPLHERRCDEVLRICAGRRPYSPSTRTHPATPSCLVCSASAASGVRGATRSAAWRSLQRACLGQCCGAALRPARCDRPDHVGTQWRSARQP